MLRRDSNGVASSGSRYGAPVPGGPAGKAGPRGTTGLGPSRVGGPMTLLGGPKGRVRTTTIGGKLSVPKPVNLPSIKKEHSGNDPSTQLVPPATAGGWNKGPDESLPTAALSAGSTWATPSAAAVRSEPGPAVRGLPERRLNPHEYPSLGAVAAAPEAVKHAAPAYSTGTQDPRRWADDERDVADLRGAPRSDWAREDGEGEHSRGPPFASAGAEGYAARGGAFREDAPSSSWERRGAAAGGPASSGGAGWSERERPPASVAAAPGGLQRGAYGYGTSAHGATGQDVRRGAGDERAPTRPVLPLGAESYDFPVPHGLRADALGAAGGARLPAAPAPPDPERAAYDAEIARAAHDQERAREARRRPAEHAAPPPDEVMLMQQQRAQAPSSGRPGTPERPLRVLSRSNVGDVSASIRASSASTAPETDAAGDADTGGDEHASASEAAAEAERGRLAKRSAEAEAQRAAAAAEEERRKGAALAKLRELEERQAAKVAESAAAALATAAVAAAADAAAAFAPPQQMQQQHGAQEAPMSWRSELAPQPAQPRAAAAQWGPPGAAVGGFSGKPAASISPLFSLQAMPEDASQRMRRLGLGGGGDALGAAHLQQQQQAQLGGAQHGFWSDSHGALGMPSLSAYPLAHEAHGAYHAPAPAAHAHAYALPPQFAQSMSALDADGLDSAESPAAESERRKRGGRRVREADERRASRAAAGSSAAMPVPLGRAQPARKDLPRPREGDGAASSASESGGEYSAQQQQQRVAPAPVPPFRSTQPPPPQQQLAPVLQRGRGGRGEAEAAPPAPLQPVPASVLASTWGGNVWAPPPPPQQAPPAAAPGAGSDAEALLLSRRLPPDLQLDGPSAYAPARRAPGPFAYGGAAAVGSTWAPPAASAGGLGDAGASFFGAAAAAPAGGGANGGGGLFAAAFAGVGGGVGVAAPYVSGAQYGSLAGVYGGSMWAHTPATAPAPASAPRAGMSIYTAHSSSSLTPLPSLPLELGGADDGFAAAANSELSPAAAAFNAGGQRGYVQHRGRGHRGRGAAGVVGSRPAQAAPADGGLSQAAAGVACRVVSSSMPVEQRNLAPPLLLPEQDGSAASIRVSVTLVRCPPLRSVIAHAARPAVCPASSRA